MVTCRVRRLLNSAIVLSRPILGRLTPPRGVNKRSNGEKHGAPLRLTKNQAPYKVLAAILLLQDASSATKAGERRPVSLSTSWWHTTPTTNRRVLHGVLPVQPRTLLRTLKKPKD